MTVQVAPRPVSTAKVMKRYNDAYRVAKAVIALGTTLNVLGALVALLLFGGAFLYTTQGHTVGSHPAHRSNGGGDVAVQIASFFAASFVWLVFYVFSVIIRAQGQMLRASLDGAVHSSPFLNDDERAQAMRVD